MRDDSPVLTSEGTCEKNARASDKGDEYGKRTLAARPGDSCSFGRPEHPEGHQQYPDDELQRVLGHAAQWSMDCNPHGSDRYHRYGCDECANRELMLWGTERENDEDDFETL